MIEWFEANSVLIALGSVSLAAVLFIVAIVLLVGYLRARMHRNLQTAERVDAERAAIELELSLREQLGRLRIVREIHDVVVSSVTGIISQADGAKYAAISEPTAAVRAVASIADTARTTLADLRRASNVVS